VAGTITMGRRTRSRNQSGGTLLYLQKSIEKDEYDENYVSIMKGG